MEKKRKKPHVKRGDLVVAGIVLLMMAASLLPLLGGAATRGTRADIYRDGSLLFSAALAQDAVYRISAGVQVEVKDGRARVCASDCPDQVCVRTGWISRPGQTAVCLPNRLVVRVSGGEEALDGVTR
ncbi:MAG: NusG domain II-containing protein [Eubacteriales bacterium]|nr:NusG domain II-containing protein [Eubacteriales bacterium]